MSSKPKIRLIIFLSILEWNFPLQYLQKLAEELGKYEHVVFYAPFCKRVGYKELRDKSVRISLFKSIRSYTRQFTFYIPFKLFPFDGVPIIFRINKYFEDSLLKIILLLKSRGKSRLLYLTYPFPKEVIEQFKNNTVIYDCMEFPHSAEGKEENKFVMTNHIELTKKADIVFVNTEALRVFCERHRGRKRLYKIPSGFVLKNKLQNIKYSLLTPQLNHAPRPWVGFVGYTLARIDIDLLYEVAMRNKTLTFVVVGPIYGLNAFSNQSILSINRFYAKWRKLVSLANVIHVPDIDDQYIPNIIEQFDICIIPYNIKEKAAKWANTIKAYEYLLMGKSVVSTSLVPLEDLSQYIMFAETPEQFSRKIRVSLSQPLNSKEQNHRRRVALGHDVTEKAKVVLGYIS